MMLIRTYSYEISIGRIKSNKHYNQKHIFNPFKEKPLLNFRLFICKYTIPRKQKQFNDRMFTQYSVERDQSTEIFIDYFFVFKTNSYKAPNVIRATEIMLVNLDEIIFLI